MGGAGEDPSLREVQGISARSLSSARLGRLGATYLGEDPLAERWCRWLFWEQGHRLEPRGAAEKAAEGMRASQSWSAPVKSSLHQDAGDASGCIISWTEP